MVGNYRNQRAELSSLQRLHLVPKQPGHRGAPWVNLSAHPMSSPRGPRICPSCYSRPIQSVHGRRWEGLLQLGPRRHYGFHLDLSNHPLWGSQSPCHVDAQAAPERPTQKELRFLVKSHHQLVSQVNNHCGIPQPRSGLQMAAGLADRTAT